jgi:acyl dehydratase
MNPADALIRLLTPNLGKEIHVGGWLTIDQERINSFAQVTGDVQWIHTDPQRAAQESPYGATVAHGYLTLALLPCLTESNHPDFFQKNYPGMRYRVNYGLNKVRYPAPVVVDSRIRARTTLLEAEKGGSGVQIIYRHTVEIEGGEKPACVAEFVARVYP